jgi:hypothetical protein
LFVSIECEAKTFGDPSASTNAADMSTAWKLKNVGLPW